MNISPIAKDKTMDDIGVVMYNMVQHYFNAVNSQTLGMPT